MICGLCVQQQYFSGFGHSKPPRRRDGWKSTSAAVRQDELNATANVDGHYLIAMAPWTDRISQNSSYTRMSHGNVAHVATVVAW